MFLVVLVPVVYVCVFPTKYFKFIQCNLASNYFNNFMVIFGSQIFNIYFLFMPVTESILLRTKG